MLKAVVAILTVLALFSLPLLFKLWGINIFLGKDMVEQQIQLKGQFLKVAVASTGSQQAQGLSGRPSLCADCGMFFVYQDYQVRHFWMNQMNFPLDVLWLKDGTVVGFAENVQPFNESGEVSRMQSTEPVNGVLELNAGWIRQNSVQVGDKLEGLD